MTGSSGRGNACPRPPPATPNALSAATARGIGSVGRSAISASTTGAAALASAGGLAAPPVPGARKLGSTGTSTPAPLAPAAAPSALSASTWVAPTNAFRATWAAMGSARRRTPGRSGSPVAQAMPAIARHDAAPLRRTGGPAPLAARGAVPPGEASRARASSTTKPTRVSALPHVTTTATAGKRRGSGSLASRWRDGASAFRRRGAASRGWGPSALDASRGPTAPVALASASGIGGSALGAAGGTTTAATPAGRAVLRWKGAPGSTAASRWREWGSASRGVGGSAIPVKGAGPLARQDIASTSGAGGSAPLPVQMISAATRRPSNPAPSNA